MALGLDVGTRRIGVAVSDGLGVLASPLTTLLRPTDAAAVAAIGALVQEHAAELLVVGLPLSETGERTEQTARIEAFGRKLRSLPGTRVVFSDERLSSATAARMLVEGRTGVTHAHSLRRREAARRRLDAAAAAVILQVYLDQLRATG